MMDEVGFQTAKKSNRKQNGSERGLYIGNLRQGSANLDKQLSQKFAESGIRLSKVDIVERDKTCFALASCRDVERAVQLFRGMEFEGKRLVVEKEKKKLRTKGKLFRASAWFKPKSPTSTAERIQENEERRGVDISFSDADACCDFRTMRNKPLAQLLEDYGEQDLNFMAAKVTPEDESGSDNRSGENDSRSRLGKQGKASIHVVFSSFGYEHGAPSRRRGWSQAEPLPPLDCRELPPVPTFVAQFDGLNPRVKREILTRECEGVAESLTYQTLEAVVDAINSGYGPARPLRMSIFVGSEAGRHRSVVVCESAARSLRTALRLNPGTRVLEFVSVGTHHSDIGTKKPDKTNSVRDDDDEW